MQYVKDRTVYSTYQIRNLLTNVSIAEEADLSSFGFTSIEKTPIPEYDTETKMVVKAEPEEYAQGKWREVWTIVDRPPQPEQPQPQVLPQ